MSGSIRKNSGLTTPQNISPELRTFLKIEKGRNLSRIEVTRAINSYINIKKDENRPNILEWAYLNPDHRNLQNEKDKRIIFPDVPLAKLLRYSQYKKDFRLNNWCKVNGSIRRPSPEVEANQELEGDWADWVCKLALNEKITEKQLDNWTTFPTSNKAISAFYWWLVKKFKEYK